MKNIFKSLNERYYAFLLFLLIAVIYLHPVFLGKVDSPIDIRDALMYPWRYHAVDEKIKVITLWRSSSENEVFANEKREIFSLKIPAGKTNSLILNPTLNNSVLSNLKTLSSSNYYISFDFKPVTNSGETLNFGLSLVDNITGQTYTPGVAITSISQDKKGEQNLWYKAYFNLNNFVSKLKSVKDLNHYSIQIAAKNTSKDSLGLLYLRDLKLACDDFSDVTKVHNYFINDLVQMFTPFREYFSESIKRGKLPFWNNYIFSGTEFLAEPQAGYFHPLYFLSYLFFDHFTAHTIIIFLSFMLCGIGAYLLASYWGFGLSASLFTGIVYMFQPFNMTWFSYEHMIMNSATLPFLLLSYEKNIRERNLVNKYLLFSVLLLGLILLSGHLQYIYYTIFFFLLFTLFKLIVDIVSSEKKLMKHIFSIFFVLSIALMIGAVVLVPFFPLLRNSYRVANSLSYVKETSLPIKAFLGLFYPYYGGHPDTFQSSNPNIDPDYRIGFFNNYVYFGLLPFLISLLSTFTFLKNRHTVFFFFTVFIALLVCTGSPIFLLFREFIPGFKQLQHFRFLEIYSYSVPFLAGIGLKVFLDFFKSNKLKTFICAVVSFLTVIDLMYYSSYFMTWSNKSDYKPVPKGGSLEYLLKEKKNSKEHFRVLPFSVPAVGETKLKVNVAQPNTLLPYKIEEVSGYSSFVNKDIYYLFVYAQSKDPSKLYPKELTYFFTNPNIPYPIFNFKSKILDLLNVKYFLIPNVLTLDSPDVEKVFGGDCAIYKNKDYLPRVFFVPDYKVIESPKDTIIELDSERFDPRKEVILMMSPNDLVPWKSEIRSQKSEVRNQKPEARSQTSDLRLQTSDFRHQTLNFHHRNNVKYDVDFVKYDQDNITLKVKTSQAGFLVLGNNLNSNWKVKINNKEAKHYQANLVQRAVYLPKAGNYLIQFYYFPKLFFIGFGISCFALFIIFFLAIYLRFQNRTRIEMRTEVEQEKVLVKL